ncbi:hypothetical protein JW905_14995, partial [bacterium]|nr:hypothetical protein [candidate division CSSED10-310 bacterium]
MKHFLFALMCCGAGMSLLAPASSLAGGFTNLDIGTTRCARMGIVAKCPDLSAVFHNPACLADQDGSQVYASLLGAYVFTDLRLRYSDGTISREAKPDLSAGALPVLGYS